MPLPIILAPAVYAAVATGSTTTAVLSTSWMGAFIAANASAIAATSFAAGAGAGFVAAGGISAGITWLGGTAVGSWFLGLFGYTVLPIVGMVSAKVAMVLTGGLAAVAFGAAGGGVYAWKRRKERKADQQFIAAVDEKFNEINDSRESYGLKAYASIEEFIDDLKAYEHYFEETNGSNPSLAT